MADELTKYEYECQGRAKFPPLESEEINSILEKITWLLEEDAGHYYMLLCNEKRDYTVFNFSNTMNTAKTKKNFVKDIYECLLNRGKVIDIAFASFKETGCIDFWLKIDEEVHVYKFFNYDFGVISD